MFKGTTVEEVNRIIKKVAEENHEKDKWFEVGYEHGKQFQEAGFVITDFTPLWSEIHEVDYIEGFYVGFGYE